MVMDETGGSTDSFRNSTAIATGATTSYTSSSMFSNYPLISALFAFAIAQSSKFVASWYTSHSSIFVKMWACL